MRSEPLTAGLLDELAHLARRWYELRPVVPDAGAITALATLVTTREPFRSVALDDLRLLLQLPRPMGLGFTVEVVPPDAAPAPFHAWNESIAPLRIRTSWSNTMDGLDHDGASETIARIAREEGGWVVVSLWTPADRAGHAELARLWAARRSS